MSMTHSPKISYLGIHSRQQQSGQKLVKQYIFCWEVQYQFGRYRYGQICNKMLKPVTGIFFLRDEMFASLSFEPKIYAVPVTRSADVLTVFEREKEKFVPVEIEEKQPVIDENDSPEAIQRNEILLRESFDQSISNLANPERHRKALKEIKAIPYKPEIRPAHKYMLKDCQTTLRLKAMTDIAISYATRVVELDPVDDHAEINLARLLFEKHLLADAKKHVERALTLKHSEDDEKIYKIFLTFITRTEQKERLLYGRRH